MDATCLGAYDFTLFSLSASVEFDMLAGLSLSAVLETFILVNLLASTD